MNSKRMICLALAAVLCVGVLSGCAGLEDLIPGFGRPSFGVTEVPPDHPNAPDNSPATVVPPAPQTTAPVETEPAVTEPQPTEPKATEPKATQAPKSANYLKKNQKKINVFLSNFAEQGFIRYPAENAALLDFGYIYYKINVPSKLHVDESDECYYVKQKDMDTVLKDFFGKKIEPDGDYEEFYGDEVVFDKNRYEFPLADGVLTEYVAIASSMESNGDGTYTVEFDVYFTGDTLKDSYYSYTAEKAAAASGFSWEYSGTAVVREHTRSTGKESYRLIRLETN